MTEDKSAVAARIGGTQHDEVAASNMTEDKSAVAAMLGSMLERRAAGGGAAAAAPGLPSWERENRLGVSYTDGGFGCGQFVHKLSGGGAIAIDEGFRELGHRVWDTCIAVSRMLEHAPAVVDGKVVLELGAGCGLLSMVAARLGAARVVATEVPAVVREMAGHVAANGLAQAVEAEAFTWGHAEEQAALARRFRGRGVDLFVGMDVTVNPQWVDVFVDALRGLMTDAAAPGARALVGGPRHREGWPLFLAAARARGFAVTDVAEDAFHPEYRSQKIAAVWLTL